MQGIPGRKRTERKAVVLLLGVSLSMAGCVPQPKLPQMDVHYYPQCYQPFVDLQASQDALVKRTLISAAVGGAGGAVAGAVATGNYKGALIGGLVGLIGGGAVGYASGKMKEHKDDQERMRSYQADMNADMRNASRVEQYALASLQCYTREFDSLLIQYKYGSVTKEEVQARYKEIREGMSQISLIIARSKSELVTRDKEYREAFAAEAKAQKSVVPQVASLDVHRQQVKQREQLEKTKKVTTPGKKRARRSKPPVAAQQQGGQTELHVAGNEIEKRMTQAEARTRIIEMQERSQSAVSAGAAPKNLEGVSTYYEKQYLDSVVRLEEVESMNERTLAVMSRAAQNAGIDMV